MNDKKPKRPLNKEQANLVAEISSTYGTEPDDIVFFSADVKPLLGYETQCVMLNRLYKPSHVNIEPVPPVSPDSVAYSVSLQWPDTTGASAVGVANVNETIDGEKQSDQQIVWLASSRALRSALRIRGIDLLKLHFKQSDKLQFVAGSPQRSNRSNLIAQAHALGTESGLIYGDDKTLWYRLLSRRFKTSSSSLLSEPELADWVAYLKSLTAEPEIRRAAA
ncbi:MAG: hypothetical protein IT174_10585 [Acidobacteria bacterium]|nr:hypothetical protein [Acidobacteriota bacterium]